MSDDDDLVIYTLTEARVSQVRGEPDMVILAMSSGGAVRHYGMAVADLDGLAKRLTDDVKLLKAGKGKRAS